jgi:import inner membrane translocase subunit TIM21
MDPQGNEHMLIHFFLEGPKGRGSANMHMIKRRNRGEFEYKYFFVDVAGHQRIYLENADGSGSGADKKRGRLFGISWS